MLTTLLLLTAAALLSSLLTLGVAYWLFARVLRHRIESAFEARIAALREETRQELGGMIEERVRRGVVAGIASIPSSDVLRGATRTAAQTGAEIIGEGLSSLLGRRREDL